MPTKPWGGLGTLTDYGIATVYQRDNGEEVQVWTAPMLQEEYLNGIFEGPEALALLGAKVPAHSQQFDISLVHDEPQYGSDHKARAQRAANWIGAAWKFCEQGASQFFEYVEGA